METATRTLLAVLALGWLLAAEIGAYANGSGSDIVRQWVVCQYVNEGRNPYAIAREILETKYGAGNPERVKIYSIPKDIPASQEEDVLAKFGPPEATYPPPAIGLLAPTVGLLPNRDSVLWVWFALNILAVGWVASRLKRFWPIAPGGGSASDNFCLVLLALLLFSPVYGTLVAGQFSLIVLGLVLVANDRAIARPMRGLALGVALLKPSIALPFLFLPLVRREWRVLLVAVTLQALSASYVMLQTGATIDLFRDWLAVAGYFLQGIYTVQDWLNNTSQTAPWLVPAVSLGLLALCGITLAIGRTLPQTQLFAVASMTSLFWTYHGNYDFVFLLPVLLPLVGWSEESPARGWPSLGLTLFALLSLALTATVIRDEIYLLPRALRWVARLLVIGLLARAHFLVLRDVVRPVKAPGILADPHAAAIGTFRATLGAG